MEFLDEDGRRRFLFQSRPSPSQEPELNKTHQQDYHHKPTLFISLTLSTIILFLSIFYFNSEPLTSLLIWVSLSFLVGPFAPSSLTAGDIRVGQGSPLQDPKSQQLQDQNLVDSIKKSSNRRSKPKRLDEIGSDPVPVVVASNKEENNNNPIRSRGFGDNLVAEEREWSEGDFELLKKQMVKYPVGMPGRWEAVAEAFLGRHKVENVVKMAKSMGERRVGGDSDSFSRFLKDRKPVDKRVEDENENVNDIGEFRRENGGGGGGGGGWSGGEDIALLNALKAFPKDSVMRWEKITAAVPGRSKAACMKRVADLKRDFRSSKSSAEA